MKSRPGSRLQYSATGHLTSRAFAGGQSCSSPQHGLQTDAARWHVQGCSGWACWHCCRGAELRPRSWPGQHGSTPARTTSIRCPRWTGGGGRCWFGIRAGGEQFGRLRAAGSWKGDAVRAALCLQDSRGQCCSQRGAGFSSCKLLAAAPALRATAWRTISQLRRLTWGN